MELSSKESTRCPTFYLYFYPKEKYAFNYSAKQILKSELYPIYDSRMGAHTPP